MNREYSENVWSILACPSCAAPLSNEHVFAQCSSCSTRYEFTDAGALNLRLQKPKRYSYEFELGLTPPPPDGFEFGALPPKLGPEVDFSGFRVPFHLTKELLSYIPQAKSRNSLALDLGCGEAIHREVCEHAGFEYVGLDYSDTKAPIIGDAHALPFRDMCFDFTLSIAVLEHIRVPFVMAREAHRVLKPNSLFLGTVAFQEPFHSDSYYHHSHLGAYNSLKEGGFLIDYIAPTPGWTALSAQARMGLFPKMPSFASKTLITPLQLLHRLWWAMGGLVSEEASEERRRSYLAGSFSFVARRGPA